MTAYLLDHMFAVPELRQTAEELSAGADRARVVARAEAVDRADSRNDQVAAA